MKKITSFVFATLLSVMFVSAAPVTGLQFSGAATSFIDLGIQPTLTPTHFTIEVWVNYQSTTGGYLISNEGFSPTNHGYSLRTNGQGKFDFSYGTGAGSWPGIQSTTDIPLNTWVYLAVTYSGTDVTMYINGVQNVTAVVPVDAQLLISNQGTSIGEGSEWKGRQFIGQMSDFRILNVVRTAAEITLDMSTPITGTETGLVAGWKMNEGAGTMVADATGALNITKPADVAWFGAVAGVNTVNNSLDIASAIYGRNLQVTNNTIGNAQFAVYSVTGQKIMEDVVASGATIQKQLTTTKGAYILKSIAADGSSTSKKFIIAE